MSSAVPTPSPADEQLARALLARGLVPRETLQALLAERDPRPLAQRLVERGLVPRAALEALFAAPGGAPPASGRLAPSGRLLASTASAGAAAGPPPPRPEPRPGAPVALQSAEVICEGLLGRGGMGAVYLVRDPRLGRRAALKLALDAERDARRQLRFKRETLVTAQLDHPNIPPVYEAGRTPEGRDYLLMRYVGGRALSALLAEAGPGASTCAVPPPGAPGSRRPGAATSRRCCDARARAAPWRARHTRSCSGRTADRSI